MGWKLGRQSSGYYKFKIIPSKLLKFDVYLLKFPVMSSVRLHCDPSLPGFEHHRFNIVLKHAAKGGEFYIWRSYKNYDIQKVRFNRFRPDKQPHGVSQIRQGTRWVLSIGWLKKEKR